MDRRTIRKLSRSRVLAALRKELMLVKHAHIRVVENTEWPDVIVEAKTVHIALLMTHVATILRDWHATPGTVATRQALIEVTEEAIRAEEAANGAA